MSSEKQVKLAMPLCFPIKKPSCLCLVMLMLLLSICGCRFGKSNSEMPLARQGVLDLRNWDFHKNDSIELNGEWEFYWKQLYTPDAFSTVAAPVDKAYFTLPNAWRGVVHDGQKLPGDGYATFRLQILPGTEKLELALNLAEVNSAFRLWANGTLLVESGAVGKDADREIPSQAIKLPRLTVDGQPVELLLQISNFHYRDGGVVSAIKLGLSDRLESEQQKKWGLALICIGSLLVMGIYHIALFCFRRKDPAPLYFGIYSLLWMASSFTSNASNWAVLYIFDSYPVHLVNRFDLICFVISNPVGYTFFRTLYPEEFSRRLHQVTWIFAIIFTVMGLATSTMLFTTAIPVYYAYSTVMILYCIARLYRAVQNGRQGAFLILLGFLVMGIAGINDMLCDLQLIRSVFLIHVGMFVFILFQAVAISLRFSNAFTAVEQLSDELSQKNLKLEEENAERTKLEREIVNICEDERRRISHDLHDGLCQQLTGARLHFSVLKRKLAIAGQHHPEMAQLSVYLEESVNVAYDLSRGLWPVEHEAQGVSDSLEELARRLSESSGIAVEFSQKKRCHSCRHNDVVQLYRIAQEAITNAVKHSRASHIVVNLDCKDHGQLTLTVKDNGIGRSAAARTNGGLGMGIMYHRARICGGKLIVLDAAGGGTEVSCVIPCVYEEAEDGFDAR